MLQAIRRAGRATESYPGIICTFRHQVLGDFENAANASLFPAFRSFVPLKAMKAIRSLKRPFWNRLHRFGISQQPVNKLSKKIKAQTPRGGFSLWTVADMAIL